METTIYSGDSGPISLPFTDIELSAAINDLPSMFGQLTAEGYFAAEPLSSDYVEIDIMSDVVSALPAYQETVAKQGDSKALIFKVPPVVHFDRMLAADIKNMLAIVSRSKSPETAAKLMNKRLQRLKNKFNLTWELMKMGGLKGVIIDGKGTEMCNFFTSFNVTKKVVYFDLSSDTADIQGSCDQLYALISQDLGDEIMSGVEVRVDRSFFNRITSHPKVKEFYLSTQNALSLANIARGTDNAYRPRQFEIFNVRFKEEPAVVPMWGGTSRKLIDTDTGHAYPLGTLDSHTTYVAPPDDVRELDGSPGNVDDAIHVTTEALDHGAGFEFKGQMHVLPIWRRPKLLVEVHADKGVSTKARGD